MDSCLAIPEFDIPNFRLARTLEQRLLPPRLTNDESHGRAELERFIHTVFRRVYGANITHYMPTLLSLHDQDDRVLAVCGLRRAETGRLYLEHYLQHPIETVLSNRTNADVTREHIVEVGNLAVTELGMARSLLREVIHHLQATDVEWVVFTAIPALRNSLGKLNMQLEVLCDANLDQVPAAERPNWGSYYEQQPQVMAIRHLPC